MHQLISFVVVLLVTSAAYAQLPDKPRTPTPTPLFREAFLPKGGDVLLSYPMDAEIGGKPVWLWKYHKRKLTDLVITNASGEKLTEERILKALEKPTIVLVSTDGKPVHPYYLRIIKPETLVIIDKTPKHEPPKQPISKGAWSNKNKKPESVTFVYGTPLTAKEIDQLASCTSLTRIVMGYAGVDSEFVEIDGDLLNLGRLKNLEEVHLCVDAMNDDHLKFIALLPKLQTLEFNADNGYDGAPICTDQCADYLSSARTLRSLVIHDGKFTDKFVAQITEGLPNLEVLSLNSAELTDESLRLLSERCKKLKSLSIASDHFTAKGLTHLDKLKNLTKRAVSSPALRKKSNPKEVLKLLGTWEYVSATYEGKPISVKSYETITLTEGGWTLRRNGKFISSSTWEIDSTRSPKWLTQFTEGGKVNFVDRWVYKFDGERLVLCKSSWIDERRPKEFVSRKGDSQYLFVLRRNDTKENPNDASAAELVNE